LTPPLMSRCTCPVPPPCLDCVSSINIHL